MFRDKPLGQQGFTLTKILVILALFGVAYAAWKVQAQRTERQATQKKLEAGAVQIRDHIQGLLKNDLAWKNTVSGLENKLTTCLTEHTSCAGKAGPISVRDPMNRVVFDGTVPSNGFTPAGASCAWFSEAGTDDCPFRLEVRWEPYCKGDCVAPESVTLTAKFLFRPGPNTKANISEALYGFSFSREAIPSEPRSCLQILGNGRNANGTYHIRPDPKAPGFEVYCDQTTDGGGWALVVNTGKPELGELPVDKGLVPQSHGRMPTEQVAAILNASEKQNENNIRIILPEVDGGFTAGASANGGVEPVSYKAHVPAGDCRKVQEAPAFATKTPADTFGLELSGDGNIGFANRSDARSGYIGFYVCMGSSFEGTSCGKGCGRQWNGSLVRQKGSIWIR
jgi:type II secretory pathway pseudopilin PulG